MELPLMLIHHEGHSYPYTLHTSKPEEVYYQTKKFKRSEIRVQCPAELRAELTQIIQEEINDELSLNNT